MKIIITATLKIIIKPLRGTADSYYTLVLQQRNSILRANGWKFLLKSQNSVENRDKTGSQNHEYEITKVRFIN